MTILAADVGGLAGGAVSGALYSKYEDGSVDGKDVLAGAAIGAAAGSTGTAVGKAASWPASNFAFDLKNQTVGVTIVTPTVCSKNFMMEMKFIVFYLLFLLYPCLLLVFSFVKIEKYTHKQKNIFEFFLAFLGMISAFGFSIIIAEAINIDNPMDSWIFRFLLFLNGVIFLTTIRIVINLRSKVSYANYPTKKGNSQGR